MNRHKLSGAPWYDKSKQRQDVTDAVRQITDQHDTLEYGKWYSIDVSASNEAFRRLIKERLENFYSAWGLITMRKAGDDEYIFRVEEL